MTDNIIQAAQPRQTGYFTEVICETVRAKNVICQRVASEEGNIRKLKARDIDSTGEFRIRNIEVEEKKSSTLMVSKLVIKKVLGVYFADIINNKITKKLPLHAGDYLDVGGTLCFIFRKDEDLHLDPKIPNMFNQRVEHVKHITLDYDLLDKIIN